MNTNFLNLLYKWNDGIERGAKAKFAKALGITQSVIGSWIMGRQKPGEVNIRKMSVILGVSARTLKEIFGIAENANQFGRYVPRTPAITPEDYANMGAVPLTPSNTIKLPILADVPAGLPEFS